jgi:hypothetical protein
MRVSSQRYSPFQHGVSSAQKFSVAKKLLHFGQKTVGKALLKFKANSHGRKLSQALCNHQNSTKFVQKLLQLAKSIF